jgi:hypothetical protein
MTQTDAEEYSDRIKAAVDNIPFALMDAMHQHLLDLPTEFHPLVMSLVARRFVLAIESSAAENLSPVYRLIIEHYSHRMGIGVEVKTL